MNTAVAILTSALVLGSRFQAAGETEFPLDQQHDPPFLGTCLRHLNLCFEAVEAFRLEHDGVLPRNLDELVERGYVADGRLLWCPRKLARRQPTGEGSRDTSPDQIKAGYQWEFGSTPVPGTRMTTREFKQAQITRVGEIVPMVRCKEHTGDGGVYVNLATNGRLFGSSLFWESVAAVRDRVPSAYLVDTALLLLPSVPERIAARTATLDERALDIAAHYNALLEDLWLQREKRHVGGDTEIHLGALAKALAANPAVLGRPYDARGLIQLDGTSKWASKGTSFITPMYPRAVRGIPVARKCRRLCFLGGVAFEANAGVPVAKLVFKFRGDEGGEASSEAIWHFGREVACLWGTPAGVPAEVPEGETRPSPRVVWRGANPAAKAPDDEKELRVFEVCWTNPRPEAEVETFDFISLLGGFAAPFMIAATAE